MKGKREGRKGGGAIELSFLSLAGMLAVKGRRTEGDCVLTGNATGRGR